MTDDQSAASLWQMQSPSSPGVMGHLMKSGITFLNSFTVASQCQPSRASFLSGQYAHNHGLYSNAKRGPHDYASLDESTLLPVWLKAAGYKTCYVGKYMNHWKGSSVPEGCDEFYGLVGGNFYDYNLNENGKLVHYGTAPSDYSTTVLAAKAAAFLSAQAQSQQPFFLFIGLNAPHEPATGIAPYRDTLPSTMPGPRVPGWDESVVADKPAYIQGLSTMSAAVREHVSDRYRRAMESLQSVNEAVDTVMTALLRAGRDYTNTLVIYTSDNGLMTGEHRMPQNKVAPYEQSIRVPLVIAGLGTTEMTRSELVANIDLTATIVELAQATPTRPLDGKSLLPLLTSTAPDPAFRQHLLVEFMEDWQQNYPLGGAPYTIPAYGALRSHEWKYVKYSTGETELYDMQNDPYELESRHADPNHAAVKADLDALLTKAAQCRGPSCRL